MDEVKRLFRDILALTFVAGNGGYVADIGPVTYGDMLRLVGALEFERIEDLRAWAEGRLKGVANGQTSQESA